MKFPVKVRHRRQEAVIYRRTPNYPFYRLAYRAAGKRVLLSFATYSEARREADKKVRELATGSGGASLSRKEAADALVIRDLIETHRKNTGRTVTALEAVTGFLAADKSLGGRSVGDAVQGYLDTVPKVSKALKDAAEEFVAARAAKAVAKEGKRPVLNPKYVANTAAWIRGFAATFHSYQVGDLTKEHLNIYLRAHSGLSVKSKNDRRALVKQFLGWCVRNDYLARAHRLTEADEMEKEPAEDGVIDFYRPAELRTLLEGAKGVMRAVIALQALGGLRLEECLRLEWREVFGIPGHVEVVSSKAKTRQRRLVEICPALSAWLAPFRGSEGKVSQWKTTNGYVQAFVALRKDLNIPSRKNGLRRGFVTHYQALHRNENATAAAAGTSVLMIHEHYRGLATRAEAQKWFAVRPPKPQRGEKVIQMPAASTVA